ncbi:MAG TPA: membrane protein insertion efficiency factor YidD [Candidatus Limosilactobacillus faecipullorum]|nr:membrane protein insertion efficiency factor YidD [Candidatus Limosilactobacillus faecipullorum]
MGSKLVIKLVRWYQCGISVRRPCRVCRFEPTCSNYMIQAVQRFGLRGVWLGLWRILRCQPFSRGGVDPVPLKWPGPKRKEW